MRPPESAPPLEVDRDLRARPLPTQRLRGRFRRRVEHQPAGRAAARTGPEAAPIALPAAQPAPSPEERARTFARLGSRALRFMLLIAAESNYFVARGPVAPYRRLHREAVNREFVNAAATELLAREIAERGLPGAVAELGVYRGGFARMLNSFFADRTLFLFDTFTGFDARDVEDDMRLGLPAEPYAISPTSVELVRSCLPHPARSRIRPGWFPESAAGLEREAFCFVHVDVGLHHATAAGLDWFYPRLVPGGYLVVADYNNAHTPGVKRAVRAFAAATGAPFVVLPDLDGSAVIAKPGARIRAPG
jgi:O-methyltransferase